MRDTPLSTPHLPCIEQPPAHLCQSTVIQSSPTMIHPSSVSAMGSPQSMNSSIPAYSSMSDFEIERGSPLTGSGYSRPSPRKMPSTSDFNEHALRTHLPILLAAKSRAFSVSGLIPLDPTNLVVFFRSKVIPVCLRRREANQPTLLDRAESHILWTSR